MPHKFDAPTWTTEEAISLLCPPANSSEVRAWLRDRTKPFPSFANDARVAAPQLVSKLCERWGENINGLVMPPVVWIWFAMSKAKSLVAKEFRSDLETWLTRSVLVEGRMPLAQCMSDGADQWRDIDLNRQPYTTQRGIPVASLVVRTFPKKIEPGRWRLTYQPLSSTQAETPSAAPKVEPATREIGRSSPGCEGFIMESLKVLCQGQKGSIRVVKRPQAGQRRFVAHGVQRSQVLKTLRTMPPFAHGMYGDETILRSLSILVEWKRGAPVKTARMPKTLPIARRRDSAG